MDVREKLDEIRKAVENARAMPMSASCVMNRTELLADLAELAGLLPAEFAEAHRVLVDKDAVIDQGRAEAQRLVEDGQRQRESMIKGTDIYRAAQYAADELRTQSEQEAAALRRETDDYVDQKLAGFEIALQKTLASVLRGRDRLAAMPAPKAGADRKGQGGPNGQARREVDDFIEQKLGRFEQTLRKSLDSVMRGRERLLDRSGLDTFGVEEDEAPLPS